jgi:hypothetical protein
MRTERPEPILPARNLAETRAFKEWGMRELVLTDPSGNEVRVGHDIVPSMHHEGLP